MKLTGIQSLDPKVLAKQALEQLDTIRGQKVLVLGDVGLDEYLSGSVRRISPEAPVPVLEVNNETYCAGLAGNVAQNLAALGGEASLIGVVGNDSTASHLRELLLAQKVKHIDFLPLADRPTTRKVRAMSGQHHLVRIDYEKKRFLEHEDQGKLLKLLEKRLDSVFGVILQDYGKGLFSYDLCQETIKLCQKKGKKILVDPYRTTPLKYYEGADLIKPNRDEAFVLSGLNLDDLRENKNSVVEVGQAILNQTQAKKLVITQGQEGVLLFENGKILHVPTRSRSVFDVTGAGDTYVAALSLAWFAGMNLSEAAILANAASGVVVEHVGSVPCTYEDLKSSLEQFLSL